MHPLISQYLHTFHCTHGKPCQSLEYRQGLFVFEDGVTVSEDQLRAMMRTVERMGQHKPAQPAVHGGT